MNKSWWICHVHWLQDTVTQRCNFSSNKCIYSTHPNKIPPLCECVCVCVAIYQVNQKLYENIKSWIIKATMKNKSRTGQLTLQDINMFYKAIIRIAIIRIVQTKLTIKCHRESRNRPKHTTSYFILTVTMQCILLTSYMKINSGEIIDGNVKCKKKLTLLEENIDYLSELQVGQCFFNRIYKCGPRRKINW